MRKCKRHWESARVRRARSERCCSAQLWWMMLKLLSKWKHREEQRRENMSENCLVTNTLHWISLFNTVQFLMSSSFQKGLSHLISWEVIFWCPETLQVFAQGERDRHTTEQRVKCRYICQRISLWCYGLAYMEDVSRGKLSYLEKVLLIVILRFLSEWVG